MAKEWSWQWAATTLVDDSVRTSKKTCFHRQPAGDERRRAVGCAASDGSQPTKPRPMKRVFPSAWILLWIAIAMLFWPTACSPEAENGTGGDARTPAQRSTADPAQGGASHDEATGRSGRVDTATTPDARKSGQAEPDASADAPSAAAGEASGNGFYALDWQSLEGESGSLAKSAGKVSLVVNVASRCGYTGQYAGLQKLHDELTERGFQVLGFPCNDFGGQEPGTAAEIRAFCTDTYSVGFPMFAKVRIKGEAPSPVFRHLTEATGQTPSWNFCKYLIGRDGRVLGFWPSSTTPDDQDLRTAILTALD